MHRRWDSTHHFLSNHVVDVEGDLARLRAYGHMQSSHVTDGISEFRNHYDIRLSRSDAGWKIFKLQCWTLSRRQWPPAQFGTPVSLAVPGPIG
jgi:hypothetical protein